MAYSERLAERVRTTLKRRRGVAEQKMFGGICFTLHGNMCCGVVESDLVLRLGEAGTMAALQEENTRPMDFTGKPLKTMVFVSAQGCARDEALKEWVVRAIKFCQTLPRK